MIIIRKEEEALVISDVLGVLFSVGITTKLGGG